MEKHDREISIIFWGIMSILMVVNFLWMMTIGHPYMGVTSLVLATVFFFVAKTEAE